MKVLRARVREWLNRRLGVPTIPLALDRLKAAGFSPRTIFDVGAYQGEFTRYCLERWPAAQVACFEVLPEPVQALDQLAAQDPRVRVFPMLLGAQRQEAAPFHESETASSVLSEQIPQNFPVRHYPMRTVDGVIQESFQGTAPDFLKLDVQGYELEVLKGAERSLIGMQGILAEINLIDIHQGAALLAEVTRWLDERGWAAYDICALTRRPLDKALWQADMIFVPRNALLRASKAWSR
jgi:FkbM family methyltransferase